MSRPKTSRPSLAVVATLARLELKILLRSRWVLAYAVVLAVLVFAVGYFGLAVVELVGFQQLDRTAVSLVNLMLYLVPLASMLMAVPSFRTEGGMTEQLVSEPVTRTEIVLGKLAGLAGAHSLAVVLGFSFTGVLIGVRVGTRGLGAYLAVVAFALLVGAVFLSLSVLLTVLAGRGVQAYALVLVVWFVAVLLFDLGVVGLSFALPERAANRLAVTAVFVNPVDGARVAALLVVSGKETFGAAGAVLARTLGGEARAVGLLLASLLAWILVPAGVAAAVLERQDL